MIIDTHTHVYPNKIAEKAVQGVGNFYGLPMKADGTTDGLLKIADEAGISKCLICSVATKADQVMSINSFIAKTELEHSNRFIGFGTVFPNADNIEEQVENIIENKLHGIKLHPDFQQFNVDSPEAMRLYEIINGRLPILFHAGDYRTDYSSPNRFLNVSKKHPELNMILAHFGGWSIWGDHATELAKRPNIWVDTSSSMQMVELSVILELINIYGTDRIFFGSDFPMWNASDELRILNQLNLNSNDYEKITYQNFELFMNQYNYSIK